MVPFQEVLFEVRKVLQEAPSDTLPAFLSQLLEAQVFSAQYFQSLFQSVDPERGDLTDVEDLARRLALPIWQKWDISKEILFSAPRDTEDSQAGIDGTAENDPPTTYCLLCGGPAGVLTGTVHLQGVLYVFECVLCVCVSVYVCERCGSSPSSLVKLCVQVVRTRVGVDEQIALDPQLLELIPDSLLLDLISTDLHEFADLDALCAELKEDNDPGEAPACPALADPENEHEKRPSRKREAGERASRKTPRPKLRRTAPPTTEDLLPENPSPVSSPPLHQLVHVPLTITTALNSASLLPSSGTPALQIIQTFNQLSPPVINGIVPVGPTYVLVSPQSVGPVHQIVPLSPADGAVAPLELNMTIPPMTSLSESVSRGQPPSPLTPVSPTKGTFYSYSQFTYSYSQFTYSYSQFTYSYSQFTYSYSQFTYSYSQFTYSYSQFTYSYSQFTYSYSQFTYSYSQFTYSYSQFTYSYSQFTYSYSQFTYSYSQFTYSYSQFTYSYSQFTYSYSQFTYSYSQFTYSYSQFTYSYSQFTYSYSQFTYSYSQFTYSYSQFTYSYSQFTYSYSQFTYSYNKTLQEDSPPTTPKSMKRPVIPKPVEDYTAQLKSHLGGTCSMMQGGLRMESHYIDTQLVQRRLVVRTGKNANKCLEKELVVLSDSERKKATVDRSHIFQSSGAKPKRLITVLGKAGMGKSTFIQRVALDWSTGGLPQFQFVFLVNCKVLNLTEPNYSLKTLLFGLSATPGCDHTEAVFQHVLSNPGTVLIAFDSFDDIGDLEGLLQSYATSATESGYSVRQLFSGLFQKKILPGCTLLMATRPKDVLNQLLRKVDSIIELSCFSPRDIELYTSNYFTDATKRESVLRKLQSQKYIFSLCANPLLCRITCFLMEHQDADGYVLPSTLTDLCQRVLDQHLELKAKEQGSKRDMTPLCKMAWEGIKTYSSLLSQDQEISTELLDHGISCEILASHTACEEPGKSQVTYFSNLFMQNLLGALLLVQSKNISDKTLVAQTVLHLRKRKVHGEWQDVLQRFVMGSLYQKATPHCSGILQSPADYKPKRNAVEAYLENLKPGELMPSRLLELFHCVYEASSAKLTKLLLKKLPDNLSFCGAHLTPSDVYVVWHLLQHATRLKRTFFIDLQDTCLPLSGLKELVELSCVTSFRAPTLDTIDLWEDLHRSGDELNLKNAIEKFTIDPFKASQLSHIENLALLVQIHREKKLPMCGAEAALEDGIPAVRHLHKLEYELGQQNGPEAFLKLTWILPALQSLQHLDLENNKIGDCEAEKLAGVLHSLSSLKMLNLSQNCIGDAGVEKLAQALSAASSLQSLSLYENLIADNGAEKLAAVLPAMKSLLDLDVKYNKFTDVGAKKLGAALKSSPAMKSLQMWNNCIPLGVFEHLRHQDSRIRAL
ncbi:hypothetical protein NFI96_024128 [Prochilodus magdalenae]|nr:hypothetical protein NFI96_024128 [Prochilodus magdalenae]